MNAKQAALSVVLLGVAILVAVLALRGSGAGPGGSALQGTWQVDVHSVDGPGTQFILVLNADRTAALATIVGGSSQHQVEHGSWEPDERRAEVRLAETGTRLLLELQGDRLVMTEWDRSRFGPTPLRLRRPGLLW